MNINVLVTGASGQLGSEIQLISEKYKSYNFLFTDVNDLDITNLDQFNQFVKGKNVGYIINCAAYTQVDQAEQEQSLAKKVNDIAVKNITEIAEEHHIKVVHISTDYVFDGKSFMPLKESDPTKPIGVYGKTKRAGELHLINSTVEHLIVRTSWLYSNFQNNFVKTMLRLAEDRDQLTIISDQIGTPTYAADLATVILDILPKINQETTGIYHFSNEGAASWYDFAYHIIKQSHLKCNVLPIATKDYKTLAERPYYSILNKSKIKEVFGITINHWTESLKKCLDKGF